MELRAKVKKKIKIKNKKCDFKIGNKNVDQLK
jgi:hypothetical protein